MTTGIVVGSIFFARDDLLGVEELAVGARTNFISNGGLEINHDATRNVLASTGFGEEGVEGIITSTDGLIRGHLTIRLDTVFKAEKFPASITRLDTGLTNVNSNDFTHLC